MPTFNIFITQAQMSKETCSLLYRRVHQMSAGISACQPQQRLLSLQRTVLPSRVPVVLHNKAVNQALYITAARFSTAPSSSSPESPKATGSPSQPTEEKKPKLGKFAEYTQKYGKAFVVVYLSVYVVTLFALFIGVTTSDYNAREIIEYAKTYEFLRGRVLTYLEQKAVEYPSCSDFVAAWCLAKLTEPVRIIATVFILSYLAKKGKINTKHTASMLPLLGLITPQTRSGSEAQ